VCRLLALAKPQSERIRVIAQNRFSQMRDAPAVQ
jgi:hypothetical protein